MDEPSPRSVELFFELFESLPRQGPGHRACAARALRACDDLPAKPRIVDLGCGVGGQTVQLVEMTDGTVVAVDCHAANIERLNARITEEGWSARIAAVVGDFLTTDLGERRFDLVWSEGALYNAGLRNALILCRGLLRAGGYLAFTDAVWRRDDPPAALKDEYDRGYPSMGTSADTLRLLEEEHYEVIEHFILPDEAWWDDFYAPMEVRIAEMRLKYAADREALAVLDLLAKEPANFKETSEYVAYQFFVARIRSDTVS